MCWRFKVTRLHVSIHRAVRGHCSLLHPWDIQRTWRGFASERLALSSVPCRSTSQHLVPHLLLYFWLFSSLLFLSPLSLTHPSFQRPYCSAAPLFHLSLKSIGQTGDNAGGENRVLVQVLISPSSALSCTHIGFLLVFPLCYWVCVCVCLKVMEGQRGCKVLCIAHVKLLCYMKLQQL